MKHALDCGMCCGLQVCDCVDDLSVMERELREAMRLDSTWELFLDKRCKPEMLLALIAMARLSGEHDQLDSRQPPG